MLNPIFYVYELVCNKTGKWYVGCSLKKNSNPSQLGVSYFTSSNHVKNLFKTDSSNFTKKIIVESSDKDYIFNVETSILKFRDAKNDPLSWNCHNNDKLINPFKGSQLGSRKGGLIGGKSNALNKTGICGRSKEKMSEDGRKAGLIGGKKGGAIGGRNNTFENRSKAGKLGILKVSKEAMLVGTKIVNSQTYRCVDCHFISTPAGIGAHHKHSGHILRERI